MLRSTPEEGDWPAPTTARTGGWGIQGRPAAMNAMGQTSGNHFGSATGRLRLHKLTDLIHRSPSGTFRRQMGQCRLRLLRQTPVREKPPGDHGVGIKRIYVNFWRICLRAGSIPFPDQPVQPISQPITELCVVVPRHPHFCLGQNPTWSHKAGATQRLVNPPWVRFINSPGVSFRLLQLRFRGPKEEKLVFEPDFR